MIDILILAALFFMLLSNRTPEKEVKPYVRGRMWACAEYYEKARTLEDLKLRVTRNLEPDDFERGALDAIQTLEKRYKTNLLTK